MTVYTLLEEQAVQQKPPYKKWCLIGLSLTAVAVAGYFILTYQHIESDQDAVPEVNTTIPARSINFTVPTQEQLYFVDLDKYAIEDNLMQAFQKNTADHIRQITIDKLLQLHYKNQTAVAWKDRWLSQTTSTDKAAFSCDNQPLPYPILRHLAKAYFPVHNADSFYDDDDQDTGFNYTAPTLILPFAKQPKLLVEGQELCIRIMVPYRNVGKDDIHRLLYRPYPQNNAQLSSPWWDTMMTTLTDTATNASIPIHMQPWREHRNLRQRARDLNHVNNQIPEWTRLREDELYERERMHIYEAQINLPHQGAWELSSILEFVEARYNFEYGPVSPYAPIQIPVFPPGLEYINITTAPKQQQKQQKQQILEQQILEQHLALPLCKGLNNPGRWLPFPKNSSDAALAQVAGLTRDGKYWAPYACRLRHLSYEQFNRCAAKKYGRGINLYGDSNIRRSIKKFLSHGQWCKNWDQHITSPLLPDNEKPVIDSSYLVRRDEPAAAAAAAAVVDDGSYASPKDYRYTEESQTRSCYCEDFSENHWNREWFDPMARRFDLVYSNNETEAKALGMTEWDDKAANGSPVHNDSFRVSSYKWDGLTYLNIPNWDQAVPTSPRDVDVAIFSLGNWDAAFAELEPFLKDVDRLIRQIKEFYDLTKTKVIYRTAQYYCCRIDVSGRTRQVSGPRMESFEQEVQARFKSELKADIWDTYTLGESRTWDEKIIGITCPSNHVPADQVDIENQILMNGLCNL